MSTARWFSGRLAALLAILALLLASAAATAQDDPPGRVAALTFRQGSVVFAPAGETEWVDLPLNRPLTRGDRIWTDRGALAELHLGADVIHLDGMTQLGITTLDDGAVQLSLTQGSVNVRVRDLSERDNFEIGTPNLALRVAVAGDLRIDVNATDGTTRVTVRGGQATVFGDAGQSTQLTPGQQAAYGGRALERAGSFAPLPDGFDQWATDRNRREDQSLAARYVPRGVIGYSQLDPYGSWAQDATYGPVWYPTVTVVDWAPYRYGRWAWISPWGWTWIDEAPWGFAPFHYGRWARIGPRWAWVPGSFGRRPVYAPALVAFVGGSGGGFSIGAGPGIAWFPLGPGEAWRPSYRASPRYLGSVNRRIANDHRPRLDHAHSQRPEAVTAVRVEDFNGGPVRPNWRQVNPADVARAPQATEPLAPGRQRDWQSRQQRAAEQPSRLAPLPAVVVPPAAAAVPAPVPPVQRPGSPPGAAQRPRPPERARPPEPPQAPPPSRAERRESREQRDDQRQQREGEGRR